MDPRFNVQLNTQSIEVERQSGIPIAHFEGRKATVVHFNGGGREKHSELRGHYRGVRSPLIKSTAPGDGYGIFRDALRRWVGQRGVERLTWSFYGTSDGCNARVADSSFFPLLATLHSLIRSNGCSRVIETGTAHGVSAACFASAIAHREASCVVSLDPAVFPDRDELWSLLPERMRACIQARQVDAITGLSDALRRQETFHAALLDSIHTSEHVMQEFELATQLVCAGGLILIHDPLLSGATVDRAIEQIARRGYRVVRLWSADDGVREDDRLGLAVVENRCLGPFSP